MKYFLKTKKFNLRPYKLSDAQDVFNNINDWQIIKNLLVVPWPYYLKDAKGFLKKIIPEYQRAIPKQLLLAIEINGEIVGSIGIHKIEYGHKAEIGYWLSRKHWGKGIMSEVVNFTSKFAFKKFKLKRLEAYVFTFNPGSKIVLEKNGFILEGTRRKAIKHGHRYIDDWALAKIV